MEPTNNGANVAPKTIDELKAVATAAWQEVLKHADPFTDDAKTASLAYQKAMGEVKQAEMTAAKIENEAKLTEARNARLALVTDLLASYENVLKMRADKKADPAKLAESETAFETAKEIVNNELLAKYAGSTSARKSATTSGDADKTSTGGKTDEICWPLFAAGKKTKDVETETGIPRSTVWFSYDRFRKANQVPA